jgi:hypothetical protein
MESDIGQSAKYSPKDLFISRAQYASKPTQLEKNKIPKFRHMQEFLLQPKMLYLVDQDPLGLSLSPS